MGGELSRRGFVAGASALAAAGAIGAPTAEKGLKLRFLGTGAADWNGPDPKLGHRRLSSALLDDSVLIDFTATARDMIPEGAFPKAIFYTHSHRDHYEAEAALRLGVKRVYCHESWADQARREFEEAAKGRAVPAVIALSFGGAVGESGLTVTAVPANHATNRSGERTAMYLIEKGATRLLYASDTAGIPAEAARIVGIDAHDRPGRAITALVMEATMGVDYPDDWRLFAHSDVALVAQTARVLLATKRYLPPPGRPVYLTHMARTLHGTQAEIAAAVPAPLAPAYDGLEVVL
jgi:ribonuclease BN (tRNA processing enzyme)